MNFTIFLDISIKENVARNADISISVNGGLSSFLSIMMVELLISAVIFQAHYSFQKHYCRNYACIHRMQRDRCSGRREAARAHAPRSYYVGIVVLRGIIQARHGQDFQGKNNRRPRWDGH